MGNSAMNVAQHPETNRDRARLAAILAEAASFAARASLYSEDGAMVLTLVKFEPVKVEAAA